MLKDNQLSIVEDNSLLEDGELNDSSIENDSIKLLDNDKSSNNSIKLNSIDFTNSTINSTKFLDQSMQDSERLLFEIFSMDVNNENSQIKPKKKVFTGWTEQLLGEQNKQVYEDKLVNQKQAKEELRIKKEKNKLINFSTDIARCLEEKRNDIVYKIVEVCGFDKSSELCTEAKEIFSSIGMLTPNGKRRTLGGCFFQLVKTKGNLSEPQKKEIFSEPTSQLPKRKKQQKNAKKNLKKQQKIENNFSTLHTQHKLEEIFKQMNLNINVSIR